MSVKQHSKEGHRLMRPLRLVYSCVIVAVLVASAASTTFLAGENNAQLRDALVVSPGGVIAAPAYDRNELWTLDPATRNAVGKYPVGKGPVAVALSQDGKVLACVNRAGNSVTLLDWPSGKEIATPAVESEPTAIAACGNFFAITNSFSDSVSVLDEHGVAAVQNVPNIPVPIAIAASDHFLAILCQSNPEITLLPLKPTAMLAPAKLARQTLALPEPPLAIAALTADRFVTVTDHAVYVWDAAHGNVLARRDTPALDVAVDTDRIYVLSGQAVTQLDAALNLVSTTPLSGASTRIVAEHDMVIVLSPARKAWQVAVEAAPPAPRQTTQVAEQTPIQSHPVAAPAPSPQATNPPTQEPPVVEATEVSPAAPTPASPPPSEAAPTVLSSPPSTPTLAPKPDPTDEPKPELPTTAPASGEAAATPPAPGSEPITREANRLIQENKDAAEPGQRKTGRYHQMPLRPEGDTAPELRKPGASPLHRLGKKTITDALTQPTELGDPDAGFEAPDWTEPFRDIQAQQMLQELNSDRTNMSGNVHLRLGDMQFNADNFSYSESQGDLHAKGNVKIDQKSSTVNAEELNYQVPKDAPKEEPHLLEAPSDTEEAAKHRIMQGHINGTNVHIVEPTRELTADTLDYDFSTQTGVLTNARGRAGIYYYDAKKLYLTGPQSMKGEDVWVTTCDLNPPHYKLRMSTVTVEEGIATEGTNARLQLGNHNTPLYLPKYRNSAYDDSPWTLDFDIGSRAGLGAFMNVGESYEINPDLSMGPRIIASRKGGIGLGADVNYDYSEDPASSFYRASGEVHGLYTNKDRGYFEWYNRFEPNKNLVLRMQAEQWSDENFYRDYFWDKYRNRTTPRTFADVTYRQEDYIASGTVRVNTHNWINETERLPEGTFHLIERPIADHLYLTFDNITGYNKREQSGAGAARSINIARLTYNVNVAPALTLTPYAEFEASAYSERRDGSSPAGRLSGTLGATLQTRFHKNYPGFWGFSEFKHVVVPSLTLTYSPEPTLSYAHTPVFDSLDNVQGRARVESKLANIIYGRDAATGDVWQVGAFNLYTGNDIWNDNSLSNDYEIEMDVRPRPWWGAQLVGERHTINGNYKLNNDFSVKQKLLDTYYHVTDQSFDPELEFQYNVQLGDYDRFISEIYYDDGPIGGRFNARLGFAYTETEGNVFNREILYGAGYRINDNWAVGFEHRYDFEENKLHSQTYEIRRSLHCWEMALRVRERETGIDTNLVFSIRAFPGSKLKI